MSGKIRSPKFYWKEATVAVAEKVKQKNQWEPEEKENNKGF